MTEIELTQIAPEKLMIEAEADQLFFDPKVKSPDNPFGIVRIPQVEPGYQRDPFTRIKWIREHAAALDAHMLKPLEVAPVTIDGKEYFAIIDGGGRWAMHLLQKKVAPLIWCRVHYDLDRMGQAALFFKMDKELYRLRPVDRFLALLAAGDERACDIADAIEPYRVNTRGKGTLSCVGQLFDTFDVGGTRLLSKTAKVIANTWGGAKRGGEWTGIGIDGKDWMIVACILSIAPTAEAEIRDVMSRKDYQPTALRKKAAPGLTTAQTVEVLACKLAQRANAELSGKNKIDISALRTCDLLALLENRQSFHARMRKVHAG